MLFNADAFIFGLSQGLVIGPITIFGIQEGLNVHRGFKYQLQVIFGATLVDVVYLMLSAYGIARIIDNNWARLVLWTFGAYMLMRMGINSYYERPHRFSLKHLHRHKLRFLDTDFFKAFCLNLVNPLAIVFWTVVAGGIYADSQGIISPPAFAMNIVVGGLITSLIVAGLTFLVKKIFRPYMLIKLIKLGSLILISYGLWFFGKAVTEVAPIVSAAISTAQAHFQ